MKRNKTYTYILYILFGLICVGYTACHWQEKQETSEQKLLKVFQYELQLLDRFSENYLAYMAYQIENFNGKNNLTTRLIDEINADYEKMTEDEMRRYQLKWNNQFQPVIDEIYTKTRSMIINQTKQLDPRTMSKIQELTIKMEMLEKQYPAAKLKPKFFMTPIQ